MARDRLRAGGGSMIRGIIMRVTMVVPGIATTLATTAMVTMLTACSDYSVISPTAQADEFYWELRTDHRAVLLSLTPPHNTLQLTAIPYNAQGEQLVIDTSRAVTQIMWESADTQSVKVTQTGLISAEKVATRVNIYVTMTIGSLTRKDTIWVGVTSTAPSTLDSLVLYAPTGKNVVAANGTLTLAVRAKLQNGSTILGVPVSYRVNNRWLADFKGSVGVLSGIVPNDSIYVYATTTVYGVTMRDSLFLYTGLPVRAVAKVFVLESQLGNRQELIYVPRFVDPPSAPGSTFTWYNNSGKAPGNTIGFPPGGMAIDIIFDHPELIEAFLPTSPFPQYNQGGNILNLAYQASDGYIAVFRKINQPGEHWYTVEPLGVRGKITIGDR